MIHRIKFINTSKNLSYLQIIFLVEFFPKQTAFAHDNVLIVLYLRLNVTFKNSPTSGARKIMIVAFVTLG